MPVSPRSTRAAAARMLAAAAAAAGWERIWPRRRWRRSLLFGVQEAEVRARVEHQDLLRAAADAAAGGVGGLVGPPDDERDADVCSSGDEDGPQHPPSDLRAGPGSLAQDRGQAGAVGDHVQ